MKVKELIKELEEKDSYKNFKTKNPNAYFCSAMFILGDNDKIDLNFFLPNENKISSFAMPFATLTEHKEEIKNQTEIKDLELSADINNLKEIIKEKTGKEYSKIIAVLQKDYWNVTCLSGLNMCRMNINAYTKELEEKDACNLSEMIKFEKGNRKSNP